MEGDHRPMNYLPKTTVGEVFFPGTMLFSTDLRKWMLILSVANRGDCLVIMSMMNAYASGNVTVGSLTYKYNDIINQPAWAVFVSS